VNLDTPTTVADVIARVREVFPGTQAMPASPLAALNLRQVKLDACVTEGDEGAAAATYRGWIGDASHATPSTSKIS
jgi:hypothetical protein